MIERNKIVYGQWTFTDGQIHEGSVYLAMSLISDSLEANTFDATVECPDKSILDFERNAPLTYFNRGRQIGIFYVQSITRNGPTNYTISATSAIGMLIEGLHYGGIYTGQTVEEVLPSICGTVPFVVKTNLREIALYGWLPVASPRDNLSQVLFAIGAVLKTDLDGVLHIEGLWDGVSGSIGKDRMYMGPSVDYAAKVTQVVVTEHQYLEGGEETTLFEGTAQEGDIITFDEPMYNLQATGFNILESDVNYAVVTAGPGTLKGNAYVHNTRQISENVSDGSVPNVKTVTDATLISLTNSRSVAQRLVNYYKSVQTIQADVSFYGENPGDLLSTWHPYDEETVSACLESADIQLSNTLKSTESLCVGFKPIPIGESPIIDKMEIIGENTDWTVPDGVTKMRVVLISGGTAGQNGSDGEAGNQGGSIRCASGQNGTFYGSAAEGGAGGAKGKGGSGGKINVIDIDVTPGETLSFEIGAGGNPVDEPAGIGSNGTDTVLTIGERTYTSADGSTSPTGYTDVVTGKVFAASGLDGKDGAMGGNSASRDSEAEDGESSGANTGGIKSDSNKIQDGTKTGPWIYKGNTKSENVGRAEETNSNTTGYTGYEYDSEGRFEYTGSKKWVGWVSGGNVDEGAVYTRINNGAINGSGLSATARSTMEKHEYKEVQGGYYALRTITRLYSLRTYQRDQAKYTYGHLGAGGGGAAKGANGNNATDDCIGGNGADAAAPEIPKTIGTGGSGGNGGGGGGGGGSGYASVSGNSNNAAFSLSLIGKDGGKGGLHSKGTRGADGGAIIYYGEPEVIKSGQLQDKSGKYFLDRFGRRIVV